MPGMFGGLCPRSEVLERLCDAFTTALTTSRVLRFDGGIIGAHAHGDVIAAGWLASTSRPTALAIDGDAALYSAFPRTISGETSSRAGVVALQAAGIGNVVTVGDGGRTLDLYTEPSGSFPVYYATVSDGLLFSSLLAPLMTVVTSQLDHVGIIEFLRAGYTLNGRTVFEGVKRLQPGQVLRFEMGRRPTLEESSSTWVSLDPETSTPESAAAATWTALSGAVARDRAACSSMTLMMSAGWDSRTLLAVERSEGSSIRAYSHGDIRSRELRLTGQICRLADISHELHPIDDRILDLAFLQRAFRTTESLVFPHWHFAGDQLARDGVSRVSAGVFGEVVGGHYGLTMATSGLSKMGALLASRWRSPLERMTLEESYGAIRDILSVDSVGATWYLNKDFRDQLMAESTVDAINADLEADLRRLRGRGVVNPDQLLEAFIAEHRGSQYINAQLLSIRGHCNVSLPFADQRVLNVSTSIPARVKLHNRVNQEILKLHWAQGLRYPTAATLISARAPILAQEASRAARKAGELVWRAAYKLSPDIVPRPRLGWVDFEFLRTSARMVELADRFTHPIWNQEGIRESIDALALSKSVPPHPMIDQIGKMLTIQGWLGGLH